MATGAPESDALEALGFIHRGDGTYTLPPNTHVHEWSDWSAWAPRAGYSATYQRTRSCPCGIDELNTEFRESEYHPEVSA